MGFLSSLSSIFHHVGNLISGGDDSQADDQRKRPQNGIQSPVVVRPAQTTAAPSGNPAAAGPGPGPNPLQKLNPNVFMPKTGSYDPNAPLQKVQQAPAAPEDKGSAGYKLTHNAVTDLAGSIVKPTAEFGHALLETPHAIAREIQNKPITDIQQNVFGTTDQIRILKKIVGDTVNTGLLVAAPGVDNLVEKGAAKVLPDTAGTALRKIVPKVASGAVQGGAFGANSTAAEGGNLEQTLKSAGTGALVGGAGAGFFAGIPILAKAVREGMITAAAANDATRVADGVHTVNPNRPTDAAAQVGAGGAPPAAPLPVAPPPVPAAPAAPAVAPVAAPTVAELGGTATRPAGDIQKAIEDAHNAGDNAKVGQLIETLPEDMKAPMRSALGIAEPATAPKAPTAPNAPGVRAAAQKKLDSLAGKPGDSTIHDVLSNKQLLEAGKAHADTFNDNGLVNQYKNGFTPDGAADIAKGHAALERLNEIAKANPANKDAARAIDNILAGSEKEFSSGGRTVNYAQEFYDGLKGPAKTSYLIRSIDKVREKAGLPLLRDDEQAMADATAKVQSHVDAEEANKAKIATLQQRLDEIKAESEKAHAGGTQVAPALTKEANVLNTAIKMQDLALSKNTAELGKYYDTVAPPQLAKGQQAGDLGRSLMLSSIAGRGNDVATTAINSGHQLLQNTIEAAAGKFTKSGKNIDTLPSPSAIVRGMKYGLQKSKARFQGNMAAGNATDLLKADGGSGKGQLLSRSDGSLLSKVTAPIHRVVRSATEIATDLSEGIKESRVQQLSAQQGKQLGLQGENLKAWTAAQTASPTKDAVAAGDRLRDEVNNMQDNKLSDALSSISKGLGKIPYVGEQVRNMVLPFTRWTGGAIHNAVTDKNVVANLAQLTKAATKGDQQGMITAASKLAVNGVGSIGAGYTLARAGLLTHQNAQGYNDDGVYLHVGGRYIPAGFLGFFAPGLIMGSAAHDALADPKNKGSLVKTIADATGKTLANSYHALGGESLTGENNPVLQAILSPKNNGGAGGVAATVGGRFVGQYIPAVTGDINAVLNNGVPGVKGSDALNPTHEAALTKVTRGASGQTTKSGKPSTAKDMTATVENQLLNKLPVASQALPRNPGVAANDEFDRLTRGSRDTQAEIKTKADAKTAADIAADYQKRGVPDPNAAYKTGDSFSQAVENRIENKKYDAAIEGLQAQLKKEQASPDTTTQKTDPIRKQIAVAQVLKDGKYDPKVRDDYSKTSLAEWQAMGDSTSDTYNEAQYQKLARYDSQLAAHNASGNTNDTKQPKYHVKAPAKGRSGSSAANKAISSNTLGSTPNLPTFDLSSLAPQKIAATAKIPTIQQVQPGDLIKKRSISVSRTRG
jgi:hypothetical protein